MNDYIVRWIDTSSGWHLPCERRGLSWAAALELAAKQHARTRNGVYSTVRNITVDTDRAETDRRERAYLRRPR